MSIEKVTIGSLWRGVSGNVLVVIEDHGDEVTLACTTDREDTARETKADVAYALTYAGREAAS